MQQEIFIKPFPNRDRIETNANRIQTRCERLSLICFGGSFLGAMLGLVMLFVFDAAGNADAWLKCRGLTVIFTAAGLFGAAAHFMDRADEEKRLSRKLRRRQPD